MTNVDNESKDKTPKDKDIRLRALTGTEAPFWKDGSSPELPKGFKAAAVESGARYRNRKDFGLILNTRFHGSGAVFTRNACPAAPILWSRDKAGNGRLVLSNAGQANAMTGKTGLEHCGRLANAVAGLLGIDPGEALLASTGVIGAPLDMEALEKALPDLVARLDSGGTFAEFAESTLTTDTRPKAVEVSGTDARGETFRMLACVKGSGMIAPNMATMLSFVITDLPADSAFLSEMLPFVADKTFNRITVDGDTSTNDSVFFLSSGLSSENRNADDKALNHRVCEIATLVALDELSRMVLLDAEGATKLVTIAVRGAASALDAEKTARTVAESLLVKTAFFGNDANWGRIAAAAGRSGAKTDPFKLDIFINDVHWVRAGEDNGKEKEAAAIMAGKEYAITIDLREGTRGHTVRTTDLSLDYVKINASYRS
ncbi:MAG: bifunctional glutamate N-acetyltransferase/amino-acid acetyltransferase ArgJ [Deltaproteobacteria bacterium]|jgi:glutamate N-acetyltransferase/amino-acid N-acetyltransferase|nr:bifunctional glutamate N-acetyltransferase/amino-acid acetyltransferase ArgJ [Deltaproteobacteria bacterium]